MGCMTGHSASDEAAAQTRWRGLGTLQPFVRSREAPIAGAYDPRTHLHVPAAHPKSSAPADLPVEQSRRLSPLSGTPCRRPARTRMSLVGGPYPGAVGAAVMSPLYQPFSRCVTTLADGLNMTMTTISGGIDHWSSEGWGVRRGRRPFLTRPPRPGGNSRANTDPTWGRNGYTKNDLEL